MVSGISGSLVFHQTSWAHVEAMHSSSFPVEGQTFKDGESGPAISTRGEGILIAAIFRIQDFPSAVFAGGQVGGDPEVVPFCGFTIGDGKIAKGLSIDRRYLMVSN